MQNETGLRRLCSPKKQEAEQAPSISITRIFKPSNPTIRMFVKITAVSGIPLPIALIHVLWSRRLAGGCRRRRHFSFLATAAGDVVVRTWERLRRRDGA